MKNFPLTSGIFLVGAGILFGFSQFVLWKRWAVLNRPIRVEKGFALSAPFTVDVATTYEVEVQYARVNDSRPPDRDTDESPERAAAFAVNVDQTPLTGGQRVTINGNVYDSQGKPSCYLGRFKGLPGHAYRLDLRMNRDLPELAALNPHVRVRVNSAYILDMQNASTGAMSLGVGSGLLGAICLLPRLLSSRRRKAGDDGRADTAGL